MPEQYSGTSIGAQVNTAPICSTTGSTTTSFNYDSAYAATNAPPQIATANQLPPMVKVVMVANRRGLSDQAGGGERGGDGQFAAQSRAISLFTDPTKLFTNGGVKGDLDKFQDVLNALPGNIASNTIKLNYYIFQTDVLIRGAKWTNS